MVFGGLPRLTWKQDLQWRRQMARAFDDLVDDLEAGGYPLPRCCAEEAALHLALEEAGDTTAELSSDLLVDAVQGLPERPDDFPSRLCARNASPVRTRRCVAEFSGGEIPI